MTEAAKPPKSKSISDDSIALILLLCIWTLLGCVMLVWILHGFMTALKCLFALYGLCLLAVAVLTALFCWNFESNIAPFFVEEDHEDIRLHQRHPKRLGDSATIERESGGQAQAR